MQCTFIYNHLCSLFLLYSAAFSTAQTLCHKWCIFSLPSATLALEVRTIPTRNGANHS